LALGLWRADGVDTIDNMGEQTMIDLIRMALEASERVLDDAAMGKGKIVEMLENPTSPGKNGEDADFLGKIAVVLGVQVVARLVLAQERQAVALESIANSKRLRNLVEIGGMTVERAKEMMK
jgi:hypothetical protein